MTKRKRGINGNYEFTIIPTVIKWPASLNKPTFKQLQEAVGGLFQIMPDCYVTKPNIQVIINEEALLHGRAQNLQALEYCSYPIFGNVLILTGKQRLT